MGKSLQGQRVFFFSTAFTNRQSGTVRLMGERRRWWGCRNKRRRKRTESRRLKKGRDKNCRTEMARTSEILFDREIKNTQVPTRKRQQKKRKGGKRGRGKGEKSEKETFLSTNG